MDGGMILYLIVFNVVMVAALVYGLWWLAQPREPGPIARALIDVAWRVLRWHRRRKARKAARRG